MQTSKDYRFFCHGWVRVHPKYRQFWFCTTALSSRINSHSGFVFSLAGVFHKNLISSLLRSGTLLPVKMLQDIDRWRELSAAFLIKNPQLTRFSDQFFPDKNGIPENPIFATL
jgi:hypothetical protein